MLPNTFQDRLSNLQNADDLRGLFADLSYDADFDPIFLPRATKADEAAQECLAGEIELLARYGDFEIIYAPLTDWKRSHSAERLLISRLMEAHRFALWVFSDAKGEHWHLVNVKTGAGKGKAAMSRHVLRRFSFARGEVAGRTSVERLLQVDLANFIGTELEVQERHNLAFDVEAVTRDFFRDYRLVFEDVEAIVKVSTGIDKRAWTQRLFNRLMFLRFLEKKGWLEYQGDKDYLRALFTASVKAKEKDFLNERLFFTFFFGLGFVSEETEKHGDEWLEAKRGKVPYLNGGLFEQIGDGDVQGRVSLPNKAFTAILGLFDRYNFTVTESTPFDQEVGIDPEMLGKVFEELVTGRHESGSYYTPRGIVSFMSREALKGYLEKFDTADAVSKLVDDGDGTAVSDPERILEALREITVCDPACGSGAYLLGMMQELLRLREALFSAKAKDHQKIYDRKLEIIASNLYGVDKDPFAVGIAMLRLWLSLIIEFEGKTPPPLPNLKYKIESGDSLAAPLGGQKTLDSDTVHSFNEKKRLYVKSHHEEKRQLEKDIESSRAELKAWSTAPDGAFDWRTEFAEIFSPSESPTTVFGTLNLGVQLPTVNEAGFDIVLANPPFVRQELIKDQKPQLKIIFGDNFSGTADLYCYFYLRAHELLKDGGQLAFISPNKWFRAAYGAKLRAFFAEKSFVRSIVHFGDLPVFQAATAYPMIFLSTKSQAKGVTTFTEVKSLDEPYPDVRALVLKDGAQLPPSALNGSDWSLTDAQTATRLETMRKSGVPLGELVKGQIFRGLLTGFNEAFVIDGTIRSKLIAEDKSSSELIKPLVAGRDIRKWSADYKDKWLIVTPVGVAIKNYPAIFRYLKLDLSH